MTLAVSPGNKGRYYTFNCVGPCGKSALHKVERRADGEMLPRCVKCETFRPWPTTRRITPVITPKGES